MTKCNFPKKSPCHPHLLKNPSPRLCNISKNATLFRPPAYLVLQSKANGFAGSNGFLRFWDTVDTVYFIGVNGFNGSTNSTGFSESTNKWIHWIRADLVVPNGPRKFTESFIQWIYMIAKSSASAGSSGSTGTTRSMGTIQSIYQFHYLVSSN